MCVLHRAVIVPNRISELVSDSYNEEAGTSSDNIYFGNSILCILDNRGSICFSYSFFDGLRKYKDVLEMIAQVGRLGKHSGKFQSWFVTAMQRKCRV
jgi:hypothetical protein